MYFAWRRCCAARYNASRVYSDDASASTTAATSKWGPKDCWYTKAWILSLSCSLA